MAVRGMSGIGKKRYKKEVIGRLAWSKVPVTITSSASVCGGSVQNTVIKRGDVPSENNLVKVLRGHDGIV